MLKDRIIELVSTIPLESNIYTDASPAARGAIPPTQAEAVINRLANALPDAAFPWHFSQAFAQLRQPLPAMVHEPYIKLAYEHILNRAVNEDIFEAQIIQHPKWQTKRGFLEALLLLPDLRLDEVAKHTGFLVSTVMIYEQLFWNVRDRMNDLLFINELIFPETRLAEFQTDYWTNAEPRNLMLRAAYYNDLDTLLKLFGSRTKREEQSSDVSAKNVRARIMADADFVVRAGGASSKVGVLDSARKMIVATEKYAGPKQEFGDDVIGITAIGLDPGQSILETVKGLLMDDSNYEPVASIQLLDKPGTN
jgi:hypothetical protein